MVCERCGGCGGSFGATFTEGTCTGCEGRGANPKESQTDRYGAPRRLHDCAETGCSDAKVRGFYHDLTPEQVEMVKAILAEREDDEDD